MSDQPSDSVDRRVERYAQGGDLHWVTAILARSRDAVLAHWLNAVVEQPFHAGQREHAVADHIPRLYDALVAFLGRIAPADVPAAAPLEDPGVFEAARLHAQARQEEGLAPPDIVVEFRVLRQEILAALRRELPDSAPTGDVLAASLLINDVLDGAITVGLRNIVDLIEAVREDFLATTIHDVRQPLTAIKGNAQLAARFLRGPAAENQQLRDALGQVNTLVDWMAELLDTLRDASRVALHKLDLDVGTITLVSVLEEAISRLDPHLQPRVQLIVPPELDTTGQWDALRLGQVVNNLLSNALKYSPAGTPIAVAVEGNQHAVSFSVHDEGIGLTAAELPRLFQRYSRTEGATQSGVSGLGLGLYLTKGIVEAHGGRIWATSTGTNSGSTFYVMLPRRASEASEAQAGLS